MGTTKQELKVNCEKMPGIPVREQSLPCAAKCMLTGQPLDTPRVHVSGAVSNEISEKKKKKDCIFQKNLLSCKKKIARQQVLGSITVD